MWFKNLRIYRLAGNTKLTPEELNTALAKFEFQPCGNLEPIKYGWTQPLGRDGNEYVHAANGYIMICAKRQEKVLPSSIVKEVLDEKIAEISSKESRFVGRAEKLNLKEEIIFSLMPKALVKSSYDFAYIDTKNQLIVINTTSANRAEELISALRDKFKHQDLWVEEVGRHIGSGLQVAKMAINWNDSIECLVDEQFCFKRIKYSSEITEKADDHSSETAVEQFDIEFSIMTLELSAFIEAMCEAFGGVDTETFGL